MSDNTFFASESLSNRISEDILETQSRELDYALPSHGLVESDIHFKGEKLICSVSKCVIQKDIESITLLPGTHVWKILARFGNHDAITKLTLNDEAGDPLLTFDTSKKNYKVSLTKCKDDINYELQLIFI